MGKIGLIILGFFGASFVVRGLMAVHYGTLVSIGRGRGGGAEQFISPAVSIEIGSLIVVATILYSLVGAKKNKPSVGGSSHDAQ